MNGLQGRMLRLPSKNPQSTKEILLVCGHHSSIERMDTFIDIFSEYGNVTVPDLPGFGGMQSFYKIHEDPTIDKFADYLASFIKLRYKRKKLILVGVSFSVPVYVRMLQKYPDLQNRVEYCISLSGFVHEEDFRFDNWEKKFIKIVSAVLSSRPISYFITKFLLNKTFISLFLKIDYSRKKQKFQDNEAVQKNIDLDAKLWLINDFRTSFFAYKEMFNLNLCDIRVKNKIYHLTSEADHFFYKNVVEQHMQIIFEKFESLETELKTHVPYVGADISLVRKYIPSKIYDILKA